MAMRSEVVAETTKLRNEQLEDARQGLQQQVQQEVSSLSHPIEGLSSCLVISNTTVAFTYLVINHRWRGVTNISGLFLFMKGKNIGGLLSSPLVSVMHCSCHANLVEVVSHRGS